MDGGEMVGAEALSDSGSFTGASSPKKSSSVLRLLTEGEGENTNPSKSSVALFGLSEPLESEEITLIIGGMSGESDTEGVEGTEKEAKSSEELEWVGLALEGLADASKGAKSSKSSLGEGLD